MHTSPPHPRPGCKHQTNPAPPTTAPAIPSSSHTCQGSSRESLIIASDGSALWGLLVYVTSYVGSCKFMSAQCCSLSTPAVLLHVWLLRMGEDTPHISVLRPLGCCAHQWSCKFARRCNWIQRRQFLWHPSQPVHVRLDDCFYCP